VAVDDPLVAVLVRPGLDERRVGAGDLGLGHREAGGLDALAEGLQVVLLLLLGCPVEEGVHVALVGGLAVEHPGAQAGLGRLRLDHGQLDVAEPHAAPLLGHVGEPDARLLRLGPHADQDADVVLAADVLDGPDLSLARLDDLLHEGADPGADVLDLGGEGEVDAHGGVSLSR
jgi:hypothetical protein